MVLKLGGALADSAWNAACLVGAAMFHAMLPGIMLVNIAWSCWMAGGGWYIPGGVCDTVLVACCGWVGRRMGWPKYRHMIW